MRLRLHLRLVLVVLVWEWSGRIVAVPRRRRGWEIVSRGDDELHESKLEVLQAIPETPSGAPSTNSSMWPQQVRRLRAAVLNGALCVIMVGGVASSLVDLQAIVNEYTTVVGDFIEPAFSECVLWTSAMAAMAVVPIAIGVEWKYGNWRMESAPAEEGGQAEAFPAYAEGPSFSAAASVPLWTLEWQFSLRAGDARAYVRFSRIPVVLRARDRYRRRTSASSRATTRFLRSRTSIPTRPSRSGPSCRRAPQTWL